jgi:Skp family chaperone for outer membrane proteins
MKYSLTLILALCCSLVTVHSQNVTDTFTVENIPLIGKVPSGWVLGQVNDGFCTDSTFNFSIFSQENRLDMGGQIVVQFLQNKRNNSSEADQKKKKNEYKVTPRKLRKWDAHYVTYTPKKVKGCKVCGKEYMDVYVVPVSEDITMYLYFIAHGSVGNVTMLRTGFDAFVNSFFQMNSSNLDHFLLLNQLRYPNVQDTVVTEAGMILYYYNENFITRKSAYGITLEQDKYYFSGLSVELSAKVVPENEMHTDTNVSVVVGQRPGTTYSPYLPQNYLTAVCVRYIAQDSGRMLELVFREAVQIEDEAMISYYKRVLQHYANASVILNADQTRNIGPFSFVGPANDRRAHDFTVLSGSGARFGFINTDSLLQLMPGYSSAKDSLDSLFVGYYDNLAMMNKEMARKLREIDSLQELGTASPTIIRLLHLQLEQMKANKQEYERIEADSIKKYERKYLGNYYDKLDAASDEAMKKSNCAGVIDSRNVPKTTEQKPMEFIDLNAEVGNLLKGQ